MRQIKIGLTLITLAALVACGGGGGGNGAGEISNSATSTGTFVNSPTKGIKYSASPSGLSGVTDADGTFSYKAGDTVTFSLDLGASTVTLGSVSKPTGETSVLSLSVPNGGDPVAVAQILETLDKSSVDGKMDVSEINLSSGAVLTAITNALKSQSVSSSDIQFIAAGVQTALTSANAGTLKYGSNGVSKIEALNNLAKNPANQSLVEAKIQDGSNDGTSTILDIQDKTAFTSWVLKKGTTQKFMSVFEWIGSNGTYDFKIPGGRTNGTYTLANNNKNGNYTVAGDNTNGVFKIREYESTGYTMTFSNTDTGETGSITGTILRTIALADIKSKTYVIYNGCGNNKNNTVTIDSSGVSTDTCSSDVNGATWAAGPFTNTLQYTESNGTTVHYLGLIRLDKKNGNGNLPQNSVGAFVNITSSNYNGKPSVVNFKVN